MQPVEKYINPERCQKEKEKEKRKEKKKTILLVHLYLMWLISMLLINYFYFLQAFINLKLLYNCDGVTKIKLTNNVFLQDY
jgi:predicted nucleic acid-binding Zn ribbon protein